MKIEATEHNRTERTEEMTLVAETFADEQLLSAMHYMFSGDSGAEEDQITVQAGDREIIWRSTRNGE